MVNSDNSLILKQVQEFQSTIYLNIKMSSTLQGGRLGIVVGGGPAPGINGVISSVTIEAITNYGMEVIGFQNGFRHLVEGSTQHCRKLTIEEVAASYLRGGSILGTARTNPAKKEEDMAKVLKVFAELKLDALVTIGGDDTAFSGSQVAKRVGPGSNRAPGERIMRVCHVPKTIDNDLPLPEGTPTFGFETARHYGTLTTRALHADAKTTGRWYIVVSMGRAAGHLALGIGKSSAATLTIIPEEFRSKTVTLEGITDLIIGSILKRKLQKKDYGVAVLAEGLIEAIGEKGLISALGEKELAHYGRIERDDHGHLRLGELEFGRIIKDYLKKRLKELGIKVDFIDKDLGYELRSADPIPFDAEYTRDLGYGAVKFLHSDAATQYGAIISFVDGRLLPLPFEEMIDPRTSRMKPRKVNVDGEGFLCAKRYMIRLEPQDLTTPSILNSLAGLTNLTPEAFKERFEPIANL
jgi:6-phosphofructokinase 1